MLGRRSLDAGVRDCDFVLEGLVRQMLSHFVILAVHNCAKRSGLVAAMNSLMLGARALSKTSLQN